MDEGKFIASIDCCFPYSNPNKARLLAEEAMKISPNAVFMVMHELARLPKSKRSSQSERLVILEFIEGTFVHPLGGIIASLTRKMILKKKTSIQESIHLIQVVGKHNGCYNALNLAYFANDSASPLVDQAYDVVKESWERTSNQISTVCL